MFESVTDGGRSRAAVSGWTHLSPEEEEEDRIEFALLGVGIRVQNSPFVLFKKIFFLKKY